MNLLPPKVRNSSLKYTLTINRTTIRIAYKEPISNKIFSIKVIVCFTCFSKDTIYYFIKQ